jgi:hypothetical protein
MTYQEYRNYGFCSRLSEVLMAKGASQNVSTANSIAGQQLNVASQAGQRSAADYAQYKQTIQPLIKQQLALASGDRQEALSAAMPVIAQLASGFQRAKQQIMNTMPAGAARDRALADLLTQQYGTIAGTQADLVQKAPTVLATTVAPMAQQNALQELGAQLSGLQSGSQTNFQAGQLAAQQQKQLIDLFTSLAQVAGGLKWFAP